MDGEAYKMDGITTADAPKPAKKKAKAKKPTKKKALKQLAARHPTKAKKVKRPAPKAKKAAAVVARPARLDLRLTKAEKAKLMAKAAKARRTVTSIVLEMIEKLK